MKMPPDSSRRDTLFSSPRPDLADFVFDAHVAQVFPDMIRRSVPGYDTVIAMTGVCAKHFVQPGSAIYDLGCSLGASTLAMMNYAPAVPCQFVAVDNAPAMLDRCQQVLQAHPRIDDVRWHCADIRDVEIRDASLVVLNFTLQFVPLADRVPLLEKIVQGLRPGGALVLSEKIAFRNADEQSLLTELHHDSKRANGYSDLEISQKRQSIENVLIPEYPEVHEERLRQAGFSSVTRWFQCFTFMSWIAVR